MKTNLLSIALLSTVLFTSCETRTGNNTGNSNAIDSTNLNGTAPATYGPDNPANDTLPKNNVGDTGTKANTVHHTGYDSNLKK
ncbi:MAG: hypothetical protein P4L41_17200 [Flavipsychrobacter sp.]|nr:hypothetical protein [Flavipsychrobacter sp.]